MHKENDLDSLIKLFSKLPSLGPRSARRIVLHLINNRQNIMFPLIESMKLAIDTIKNCEVCGNLDSKNICAICSNTNRSNGLLCVVEEVSDLWAMEKGGIFSGKYHVLGGTLSAINGKGPEDLNIDKLFSRIKDENIEEVIMATNSTIEGQTTAYYILEILKELNVKVSKLAHGIPIGSELDYLDEGTLGIAFKLRSSF
jgi:recombination protein RecR